VAELIASADESIASGELDIAGDSLHWLIGRST
jgi:hypothetical protein